MWKIPIISMNRYLSKTELKQICLSNGNIILLGYFFNHVQTKIQYMWCCREMCVCVCVQERQIYICAFTLPPTNPSPHTHAHTHKRILRVCVCVACIHFRHSSSNILCRLATNIMNPSLFNVICVNMFLHNNVMATESTVP